MEVFRGPKYFDAPDLQDYQGLLAYASERFADRTAVRYRMQPGDEKIWSKTYAELDSDVKALATSFSKRLTARERVGVVGDNSYPWMLSYLSAVVQGQVIVPLDRLLPSEELAQLVQRGKLSVLCVDAVLLEGLLPHLSELPLLREIVCMQSHRHREPGVLAKLEEACTQAGKGFQAFETALEHGERDRAAGKGKPPVPLAKDAMAALLFTSGTTDSSKAVMLSQGNVMADVRALLETVRFVDPIKTLSMLPLHHTFENTCGFLTILALGGCIHIYDGLRYIAKNMKEYQVHMIIGVPTVFEMIHKRILQNIAKQGKMGRFKLGLFITRFLRFFGVDKRREIFKDILAELGGDFYIAISGAAPLDVEVISFFDAIGIQILQGYGLTETSPVAAGCNTQVNVFGTVGPPLSGVEMAIDNEAPGQPGEILIRGDIVMQGYYEDAEANAEAFDEAGWFHTGDIGVYDAKKGCLSITGRLKSMIVLNSGKKVFPEELERLLNQHDFVKDSLVFGQSEENGEVVVTAKIVLDKEALEAAQLNREGVLALLGDLVSKTNALLPSFKGIRSYAYSFTEMIKTTTLKVRRGLEVQALQELIARKKWTWREFIGQDLDQSVKP